jgi:hypothetical protein
MVRQAPLKLGVPKSVVVIGCGGVGTWVAYFLALAGVKELWLFDHDIVSDHNLNRVPLSKKAIGTRKTQAVKNLIHSVRPDCSVLAMGGWDLTTAALFGTEVKHVVVATDTLSSRQEIYKWASVFATYIEVAAEGEMGSATGVPANWQTSEETQVGYQSVPVWLGPCVMAAMVAVNHVVHNVRMGDRTIRMGWNEDRFYIFDSEAPDLIAIPDGVKKEKHAE